MSTMHPTPLETVQYEGERVGKVMLTLARASIAMALAPVIAYLDREPEPSERPVEQFDEDDWQYRL